jgi:hypothetical protein
MSERPLIWPVRAILWIGGGFVLIAGIQLFVFPARTDEIFAWTIDSRMSATCLGAFYGSGAVLALLSAREPVWSRARLGVPGVLAFVWLTLAATLLHLDLFHLDDGDARARIAAWTWLVIYIAEPPLLLLAFVLQLRAPGGNPPRSDPLPGPYLTLLLSQAALLLALGAVLFAVPLEVAEIWPWQLTELTGRAIAAWVVALGGLLAAIAWEGHRGRIRLGIYMLVALVALLAIALARFGEELDFSSAEAVVYLASLASLGMTAAWGWRISTG